MAAQANQPTVSQPATGKIDIHEAAGEGRLNDVKAYLKIGGLIDKRDADRWTPLMLAVREGHLEVAKVLLRSGATLEARDTDKWTAMHVVAANGHPQCCQLLLDRGGNPRALDENRRTPLHWATRYGYAAVVELLLRRGADANFKDSDGKTPLDVIGTDLAEDAREIVRTLLLEHAEKMKSSKQRRGSCPAIPRTALITAIDASGLKATATATPPAKVPADGSPPFLPLPAVTIVRSAIDPAEPSGARGVNTPGNPDQGEPVSAAVVARKGNRRGSFSSAAHIRDHPFRHGRDPAAPLGASPDEPTTTSSMRGQVPGQSGSGVLPERDTNGDNSERLGSTTKATATAASDGGAGGASLNGEEGGGGRHRNEDKGGDNDDDNVISMLKRALQMAEKRAQEAEQSRSDEEVLRRKEETRVRALEERVADLERMLLKQAENGSNSSSVS